MAMKYRLRVAAFDTPHMVKFVAAMRTIQGFNDNRSYHKIAGFHGAPDRYCWHHQFSRNSSLTARLFLPWHRAYLYHLNQNLQDVDADVALPWWDWTIAGGIPNAHAADQVNGQPNPLFSSTINLAPPLVETPIQRSTWRNPRPTLPVFNAPWADANSNGEATLAELVDAILENVRDLETFNDLMESIHDQIHGWIGGDMGDPTTAAFDPIFFAHHCMIDRIWYLWQIRHGWDRFPTALLDEPLIPFGKTVRQVLNVQELGYEYAADAVTIPLGG